MPNIANPPGGNPVPDPHSSRMTTLVLIFRIVRWTVYACALIILILLLHKSAPPAVSTTPEAAARVEQKFHDVQQAVGRDRIKLVFGIASGSSRWPGVEHSGECGSRQ
jgi:hypothetical protein